MQVLFPSTGDDSTSLDDFLREEMHRLEASDDGRDGLLDQYNDIFSAHVVPTPPPDYASLDHTAPGRDGPPQPWRQGVWCLKQRQQPTTLTVDKVCRGRTKSPGPVRTMNALGLYAGGNDTSATFHASSPDRIKRAASPRIGRMIHLPPVERERPQFSRELTLSPNPMYAQRPLSPLSDQFGQRDWQQEFQDFHLQPSAYRERDNTSTTRPVQRSGNMTHALNEAIMARNQHAEAPVPGHAGGFADTTCLSRSIDPSLLEPYPHHDGRRHGHGRRSTQHPLGDPGDLPIYAPTPKSGDSMPSLGGQTGFANVDVSMPLEETFPSHVTAAHPPLPTLAPEEAYPALVAPNPQRHHLQGSRLLVESAVSELDLHYHDHEPIAPTATTAWHDPSPYVGTELGSVGIAVPYPPATVPTSMLTPLPLPMSVSMPMSMPLSMGLSQHPHIPAHPSSSALYMFSDGFLFHTPRKQRRSPSRSPSPSVSPTNASPRRHAPRSPTRAVTDHTRSRRKSIHKPGPIRDSGSQDVPPHVRARSASRPARAPRTPKTPIHGGHGQTVVDFVNFTPDDSAKLLSDVAPSGSSKTRARRELEAREKRKRLNEAALKAVQVAGGDVAAFEKAIFA